MAADGLPGADSNSRHKVNELPVAAGLAGFVPRLVDVREYPARGATIYKWRFEPPPNLLELQPLEEEVPSSLRFSVAEPHPKREHAGNGPLRHLVVEAQAKTEG